MLIGSGLQFSQLVPFGVDETVENSYKFNNKGNQELCRQFAHRKLKVFAMCHELVVFNVTHVT